MISVLIPSRTDEYLEACLCSMRESDPGSLVRVVVADNGLSENFKERWAGTNVTFLYFPKPFVFAKAVNLCAERALALYPKCDLLVLNDDTEILTPRWLMSLEGALRWPGAQGFGLISLQIEGGVGNPEQQPGAYPLGYVLEATKTICFVAAIIRHEVWRQVGPLDERFVGYGHDDDDYCRRVKHAGWKTGVCGAAKVHHGAGGYPHSSSYLQEGLAKYEQMGRINLQAFQAKWGGAAPQIYVTAAEARSAPNQQLEQTPEPEYSRHRKLCLNIGCGDRPLKSDEFEEWINLDFAPSEMVDVVRDVRRGLPFASGTFDRVLADNVLEHLSSEDAIALINEIDRVLKVEGRADIIVPHALSQGAYQDPTHKSFWVPRSCLYWNQVQTPYGGRRIGITANLLADRAPEIVGDMQTEAFIRFRVTKVPHVGSV